MLKKRYVASFPIKTEKKTYGVGEFVPEEELTPRGIQINLAARRLREVYYESKEEPKEESQVEDSVAEEKKVIEAEEKKIAESTELPEIEKEKPKKKKVKRGRKSNK